jgi:flagellar motor switch protein FliN/FliY
MSLDMHTGEPPSGELQPDALLDMRLRVWAEIGRAQMPAAFVVGMPKGAIIDLDCGPDEPADLFVNGRHFGTGRLVLVEGEWALRVETLDADADADADAGVDVDAAVEQTSSPDSAPAEAAE